jgi:adenylate cyclase class IV
MQYKEIEFKFDAQNISVNDFCRNVESLNPTNHIIVSSYDDFFVNESGHFIRYRHNHNTQELTIKRKVCDHNNNERVEVNMPLVPQDFATINAFVDLLGYAHNFRIYKTAKIYWVDNVVLCYYIVYDDNMKELDRFIEIEANEHMTFETEAHAWDAIKLYEEKLKPLGINYKRRLRKSLFEMYKQN